MPWERMISINRSSVSLLPRERMRAITALRFSWVKKSVTAIVLGSALLLRPFKGLDEGTLFCKSE